MMKFNEVASIIKNCNSIELRNIFENGLFTEVNSRQIIQYVNETFSINGPTLLMIACKAGSIDCVKVLLDYGADLNYGNVKDLSVLCYACLSESVEMLRFVIESGLELSDKAIMDAFRIEPLVSHTKIISVLIEHISDINYCWCGTFIYLASNAGNVVVVRSLLERGANPNFTDNSLCDPFVAASEQGHLEVVQLLLTWDVDDKLISQERLVLALTRATTYGHIETVRYLFEHSIDITAITAALKSAVDCDKVNIIEYLIDKAAECNIPMIFDASLLSSACCEGLVDVARLLLTHGADPDAADRHGDFPLRLALHHPAVLKALLEAGANPNLHFITGSTGLIDVVEPRHDTSIRMAREGLLLLLQHGADPNLANAETGSTPLMEAALAYIEHGCTSLVELLLEYGADVTQANRGGERVLDMVDDYRYEEVIELCRRYVETNLPDAKPVLK